MIYANISRFSISTEPEVAFSQNVICKPHTKTAKTADKAKATNGNGSAAVKPAETEGSAKFVFDGGKYKVEVTFSDKYQHSRRGVLEALKTAFEAAKDESTDI